MSQLQLNKEVQKVIDRLAFHSGIGKSEVVARFCDCANRSAEEMTHRYIESNGLVRVYITFVVTDQRRWDFWVPIARKDLVLRSLGRHDA